MILARKIIKIPEFLWRLPEKFIKFLNLTCFCPKNARILHNNCPKNIFPNLGGHVPLCPPPSPTPMPAVMPVVYLSFHTWTCARNYLPSIPAYPFSPLSLSSWSKFIGRLSERYKLPRFVLTETDWQSHFSAYWLKYRISQYKFYLI